MESRGRRRKGSGTVLQGADGRWRGQKTVSGKKLSTRWMGTEKAAERELKNISPGVSVSSTFGKSFELFIAARGHATTTELEYRRLVEVHLGHLLNRKIADLDVEDFSPVFKALAKTKRRQTLNQIRVCITGSFDQAIGKGWASINVGRLIRLNATKPAISRDGLSPLEAQKIATYLMTQDEAHASAYLIGIRYGLRPNERRGLCWGSVYLDEEEPYIVIESEVIDERGIGTVFYPRVKTEQAHRRIYIDSDCHRLLKAHSALTSGSWTDAYDNSPDLVWRQENGRPMTTSFERNDWRRVQSAAGIPKSHQVAPYGMRHTAATLMLAERDDDLGTLGLDIYEVSRILGHVDTQLVSRVYAKRQHSTQMSASRAYDRGKSARQIRL